MCSPLRSLFFEDFFMFHSNAKRQPADPYRLRQAAMRLPDDQHLPLEFDIESIENSVFDLFGQFENLLPGGAARIDEDQCLPVMNCRPTHTPSLLAAVLDQPAGWQFEMIDALSIVGHVRIYFQQSVEDFAVDDGVFKKTAGIADHGWIG